MIDIGGLIDRLGPLVEGMVREEVNLWITSKRKAKFLLSKLKDIQNMIEETEKRRLADPRIRTWLESLRDVTYEIDDALDEWEATDRRLRDHPIHRRLRVHDNNWWNKINIFIYPIRSCVNYFSGGRRVALRIKGLNEKVDSLDKETAKYSMLPLSSDSQGFTYEISTSFSDPIKIPGQLFKTWWLVYELLNNDDRKKGDIKVISLVGMAGIGKTAVAQLAFNDSEVQSKFELKSWICASHISDMIRLTKAILQSLRVSYREDADLQMLLELIQWSVSKERFLLVLDHVWIEDDSEWNRLRASLRHGNPGSRILVTTRNEKLAGLMGSKVTIEFEQLEDEDCWLLFREKAFRGRSVEEIERLGGIGREIAKKCKGWPHAAKTLGKYLQPIVNKKIWNDVLDKELLQLTEVADALFAPFAFNYNELPLALKHCFSYCAIYEEGVWIDVDELIRLWVVQGYLSSSVADTETELRGRDYFEKLARRYFFQNFEMDDFGEKIKRCKMHPVLLNFAQYLAKTESKAKGHRSFRGNLKEFRDQIKRDDLQFIRVLLVRQNKTEDRHMMESTVQGPLMTESKKQDLPKDIGKLTHLRYINLASNSIKQLPVTICDLYNLYCLDLRHCRQLSELPEKIHRLKKLRHLLVEGGHIQRLPEGLGKLTGLQTLDAFYVGKKASMFRYLEQLDKLQGSMDVYISDLKEKEDVENAKKANLSKKYDISSLRLFFRGEVSMDVLDRLGVPPNLRQFHMSGYKGTRFPSWISDSLNKLKVLELKDCDGCLELPPVGKLPFLETLRVTCMVSLKRIGDEFWEPYGEEIFPNLRRLEFRDCASWKEWKDISEDAANTFNVMPFLETLIISGCKKLKALPELSLCKATSFRSLEIGQDCPDLLKRYKSGSPDCKFILRIKEETAATV